MSISRHVSITMTDRLPPPIAMHVLTMPQDPEAEAIYYGVACRNALLLDLPNIPALSRVELEVHRRAWWTLNMIDVWSSNGMRLPRNLLPRSDVPFPMEETVFLQLRREDLDLPSPNYMEESAASLLTQMVKLNAILVEITNLNIQLASSPSSSFDLGFRDAVDDLTLKLEGWYDNLPLQLQDTHANLARYAELGLGPIFVAVYLGYYHFGTLLYFRKSPISPRRFAVSVSRHVSLAMTGDLLYL